MKHHIYFLASVASILTVLVVMTASAPPVPTIPRLPVTTGWLGNTLLRGGQRLHRHFAKQSASPHAGRPGCDDADCQRLRSPKSDSNEALKKEVA